MAISQSGPATVVAGAAAMATLPKCEVGSAAAAAAAAAATASVTATAATAAAAAAAVAVAAVAAASISTPADALAGEASVEESASGVCETLADASSIDPNVWRIHGQDYDLSEFVKDHPGGVSAILLGKGVDCTNMFESYHVFNAPVKRLAKYALQPNGGVRRTESPFHAELRLLMREHFAGEPKWAHKAKWSHVMLVCVLGVLNGLAWIGWCAGSWLALALLPGLAWLLMVNAAHDASHFAVSRSPWINELWLASSSPLLYAGSSWRMQHVVLHHQETNVPGCDADIHHMPWSRWHPAIEHGGASSLARSLCSGVGHLLIHIGPFLFSTIMMTIVHPIKFVFYPLLLNRLEEGYELERLVPKTPKPRINGSYN